MIRSKVAKAVRGASLAAILIVGGWLLLAPIEDGSAASESQSAEDEARRSGDVRFVLKIAPGMQYMPGTTPFGIGKPIHGLADVIRDFESLFPDTRVEVINAPIGVREYLVTQLSSGQAPDIVNVNVEDVWTDIQKGWYVALDPYLERPNRFVREKGDPTAPGYDHWWDMFRFQAISRGKAAPDGLVYCLSYDMIETGIFYNKTVFDRLGLREPQDWDEFLEICRILQDAGYTPVASIIDVFSDWCTDLFFDQLYADVMPGIDLYQDPLREPYLQGYLDWDEICFLYHKGFFTPQDPRYREMWSIMKEFRQYASKNIGTSDINRDFVTQKAAMVWQSSLMVYRLEADPDLGFEYGVFYPPPFTKETSEYASGNPMCVIGGSATQFEVTNSAFGDTGDPATSERLDRVMALLEFLCLPENSNRITNEYPSLIPNIVGVPVHETLRTFEEILEGRYTTTKWIFTFDLRYAEIHRRMLDLYLNDGIPLEEFLEWQNDNLRAACENLLTRKPIDTERLQAAWDRLAPQRVDMKDLPSVN